MPGAGLTGKTGDYHGFERAGLIVKSAGQLRDDIPGWKVPHFLSVRGRIRNRKPAINILFLHSAGPQQEKAVAARAVR